MRCERIDPEPVEKNYQLTLSPEEALVLKAIMGCIGGSPDRSYRMVTEGIYKALGSDFDLGDINFVRDRIMIVTKKFSRSENGFTEDANILAANLDVRDGFIDGSEFG